MILICILCFWLPFVVICGHHKLGIDTPTRPEHIMLAKTVRECLEAIPKRWPNTSSFVAWENTTYGPVANQLSNIALSTKKYLDGSFWSKRYKYRTELIGSHDPGYDEFDSKRMHLAALLECINPRKMVEIGFNAGHSSSMMLTLAPALQQLTSFDICSGGYQTQCAAHLNATFPNRHVLYCGDSRKTVPQHIKEIRGSDMMLIDGGHAWKVALADLRNCAHVATNTTLVVMDDCSRAYSKLGPYKALQQARGSIVMLHITPDNNNCYFAYKNPGG
eukprot:NODE_5574_length_931_cov_91.272277_g5351_i0.p1 GENE.NODE_5574_length_931_cov_91.272277_g5351_i0~~NODE_5574_length_931_cov_91.272277_g5351_i0.p1  ORF type:complete len:276 (-),score=30.80 NODE_5574_length_931_cov_91.272277_g5351_i0:51-878(-)